MLLVPVELLIVDKIVFPFSYYLIDKKRLIYHKNYHTNIPKSISFEQVEEKKQKGNSSIILKCRGSYYWCPLVEEIYKNISTKPSKESFKRELNISDTKNGILLTFLHKRNYFETREVKKLIIE